MIALVAGVDFEAAAAALRTARERGWRLAGAIVEGDDAVLIGNRVDATCRSWTRWPTSPTCPSGALAAIEVAEPAAR